MEIVSAQPREFTLADVVDHKESLQRQFPNNRFIEAKIRQSLQVLRDQGVLRFMGSGRYHRLDVAPAFSPLIDVTVAANYTSQAQAARVALETWASFNLYCLNCESDTLDRLPNNTPVADFACFSCARRYQLKGKNGRFGATVSGAAYRPLISAVRDGTMPEHVFVEFDTRFSTVVFVDAIPGSLISEDRIVPRKPLPPSARRAGWQGCTIRISDLPYVRIVAPAGLDRIDTRSRWRALAE